MYEQFRISQMPVWGYWNHPPAKNPDPWPVVRDPGALKPGSFVLEVLSGGGIRGPGPWARGVFNLTTVLGSRNGFKQRQFGTIWAPQSDHFGCGRRQAKRRWRDGVVGLWERL